jgi:hypothetical protein
MATLEFDPDCAVKEIAFTRKNYRDVYPAVDPTRPELSQEGKVIFITGASRGIGQLVSKPSKKNFITLICEQGFAVSFARANAAALVLLGRSSEGLTETERLVNEINPSTKVLSIPVDVTDEAGMNKAFETAVEKLGVPQVLINNAGQLVKLDTIVNTDVESWWKTQVSYTSLTGRAKNPDVICTRLTRRDAGNKRQRNIHRNESLSQARRRGSISTYNDHQCDFDGISGRSAWNELIFSIETGRVQIHAVFSHGASHHHFRQSGPGCGGN